MAIEKRAQLLFVKSVAKKISRYEVDFLCREPILDSFAGSSAPEIEVIHVFLHFCSYKLHRVARMSGFCLNGSGGLISAGGSQWGDW